MLKTQNPLSRNRPHLLDQLREDIRRKGLRPGDRYLSANEASQVFGASTTTIHRAMNTLAEEDILVRHLGQGTFVGPSIEKYGPVKVCTVYLLVPSKSYNSSDFPFNSMICGIRHAMGEVNVQHSFVPEHDSLACVRELLRLAKGAGKIGGFVPMSCSRDVYALLAESGVPTVIFGTPYPDQKTIPSIDVDSHESGRLLMEQLIQRGHRRILLLTSAADRPGDHFFFDGVSEALTTAQLPHNALIIRVVPDEMEAVSSIVHKALNGSEHPTAVIAVGGVDYRRATEEAIAGVAGSLPQQVEAVFLINPVTTTWNMGHTCIEAEKTGEEIFALIGKMLHRIGEGQPLEQERVVIPMRLRADGKDSTTSAKPTD